jgi:hypothetical protein
MATQYICGNERRRRRVSESETINGIDFLEVLANRRTLKVHLVHEPTEPALTRNNVVVEGGVRIRDVQAESVRALGNILEVVLNKVGDLSTYTLRLVASPKESVPPASFDRHLCEIDFSFETGRSGEFDCTREQICQEPSWPAPQIDYLAKDYASFRRLMFDRLTTTMPNWQERNPADLGVALVELLAYAADHLSYYQDAVATEAYLGTARKRVSVRRHARLLDYPMHDGSNARAWVTIRFSGPDGEVLPGPTGGRPGSTLITRSAARRGALDPDYALALGPGIEVFETLHDLPLRRAHSEMRFYTWGDERCCLPKGATSASLRNEGGSIDLSPGMVLIFEEVRGPESGRRVDADPTHRHAVRLTKVASTTDPLYENLSVVDVEWSPEDALPFPLCLWDVEVDAGEEQPVSVALGNVVLVDHGYTVSDENLQEPSRKGRYRPRLELGPLTQQGHARDRLGRLVLDRDGRPVVFDPESSASAALRWDIHDVLPAIELRRDEDVTWYPRRDLLSSDRFATEFVVETEDDGSAYLRFGATGTFPVEDLKATYRIGNGRSGNVGAEAIANIVTRIGGILDVRNPLPAAGGTDPEPVEQVRLYAPHAFRTQERAVTEADYEAIAQRHPDVQRVTATRRWTGSWHTWFVTVDRKGGRPVDAAFESELRAFLERFRLAGYDLEVYGPRFVPLYIALTVHVSEGYIRGNVKQALLETFSNRDLPDGSRGFFHPDNYTFGQPVYLSQVVAAAMKVPGVAWVQPVRFQRWGETPRSEVQEGRISFDRLEIARLDNDPDAPDNGRLELHMEGGL